MNRHILAILLVVLVLSALAVPPKPGSWDLQTGTHLITGEPLPDISLLNQGGSSNGVILPTPPMMGCAAVLVDFPDHQADQSTHPNSAYVDLLFSQNSYPSGSLRDYWNEVSYGAFDVSGGVSGWHRTADNYNYNYNDQNHGLSWGGGAVADAAAELADPTFDFGLYDNDGPDGVPNSGDDDGYVDLFMVYHAGPDGADTGDTNDIWSHKSSISFTTNDARNGGGYIQIRDYAIQAEERSDGSLTGISVSCHEMGHLLDLPDLYDYSRYDFGPGYWSLMSYGAWGADGHDDRYPSYPDAWCRTEMGWTNVINLDSDQNDLLIHPAETHNTVYTLWENGSPEPSEWFYLENRQQLGAEETLPGEGLLIFHIYSGTHGFGFGFDDMDIEQADGLNDLDQGDGERPDPDEDNLGDAGDPFPGSTSNTHFSDWTNPNSRKQNNQSTWVAVTDIRESGDDILCDISLDCSGIDDITLRSLSREEGLLLRWGAPLGSSSYRLSVANRFGWSLLADGINGSAYLVRSPAETGRYRLEAFDATGTLLTSHEVELSYNPPTANRMNLSLYPNPAAEQVNIALELAENESVSLEVYDLAGRLVETLLRENLSAGRHELTWQPNLSDGVYLLRLKAGAEVVTKRAVIGR